jgi:LacI family transcriptional regulator
MSALNIEMSDHEAVLRDGVRMPGRTGRGRFSGSLGLLAAKRKRRTSRHARPQQVTLKEVADAAGVSMMTVSNVVHNRSNVGATARERVLKQIKALGYVPNRAAQELAGAAFSRFGLLYPNVRNPFIGSVFVGSLNAASRLRADISIQLAELDDPAALRKVMHRMEDAGVEGFLLPSPIAEFAATTFKKKPLSVPAIAIAPGFPIPGMASVRCDERKAAFELVSKLLDLGHTRIGHIAGPEAQTGSVARQQGYAEALNARSIDVHPDHVVRSAYQFQAGVQAAETLLARRPRVTAIFAANDTLAASVVAVAHRHDMALPEELSVVGYDDSPVAEQVWPALTTVRQDAAAMTERAVEILDQNVKAWRADRSLRPAQDVVFPHQIVLRQSIAKAPRP